MVSLPFHTWWSHLDGLCIVVNWREMLVSNLLLWEMWEANLFSSSRSELGATVGLWESWILTGLVKIPRTNSLRLSSLIHSIRPSEGILTPSGSPNRSTSTGRCEGWHLQAARAVALERATSSTTLSVVLAMPLGEGAILSSSTVTANMCHVCKILT